MSYILMLMILLATSGGMLMVYRFKQCLVEHQMEKAMMEDKLPLLTLHLTIAAFEKSKVNSHEIVFDGKMYDIRTATITHNTVELVVAHDSEEENLLAEISNLFENSRKSNRSLPADFIKLLSLVYIQSSCEGCFANFNEQKEQFITKNESALYRTAEILSPPPKFS